MKIEGCGREGPAGFGGDEGETCRVTPTGLTGEGIRRVALAEMALRRRRLGQLTTVQERALESLLVSVADNISELVSGVAAGRPAGGGQRRRAG